MSGDPAGYWNEYYTVDSHYEEITQDIIDDILQKLGVEWSVSISKVLKMRWVEFYSDNLDPYDAIAIFNDKIPNDSEYNKELEDVIFDYKKEIRDEKIKSILNE